jgi:hypothetical protein
MPADRTQKRILAPLIVVVEILISLAETEDPLCQELGERVGDPPRIAMVDEAPGK